MKNGGEKKKKKIMAEIVATNVVASRPPNGDRMQRRPTATPTARAKSRISKNLGKQKDSEYTVRSMHDYNSNPKTAENISRLLLSIAS